VHGEAGAAVVVVHGVVVRRTQQSSSVHPVAAQTGSPGTFVQGAGGHVKEEQVRCVVVVHGVVVGCRQQSSADSWPRRLSACGRLTHPAGHVKEEQVSCVVVVHGVVVGGVVVVGGAAVVHGAAGAAGAAVVAGGCGAAVVHGLEEETGRTMHARRSFRAHIVSASAAPRLKDRRVLLPSSNQR